MWTSSRGQVGSNWVELFLILLTLEPQALLTGLYMMSSISLQVWSVESIPKDAKHSFETEVTYIIVGPTHSLKSIHLVGLPVAIHV